MQLHVPGTCHILSGTGSGHQLEELGVSVDGVTLTPNLAFDDVHTDHYGPKVPYDRQYFLQSFTVSCDLVWYDLGVLQKWLAGGIPGAAIQEGTFWFAGDLVVQNELTARLVVRNTPQGIGLTDVEPCWNFPNAILIDNAEVKAGVEKSVWKLTWQVLPAQQASASNGTLLYNHLCV